MNVFSEDDFLNAFIKTYFPEQEVTIELFELGGKVWRLPSSTPNEPIHKLFEVVDFLEPLCDDSVALKLNTKKIHYLPRVSQHMVEQAEWTQQDFDPSLYVAPTICWSGFKSWEEFVNFVKQRRSRLFVDSARRQRRLEKELGSIEFTFNDPNPEVLETFFHWKQEQLKRQGLQDRFADPERLSFFQELSARGLLLTSSLKAGERLLAVCVSLLHKERFYLWNTTYDPDFSPYSPGRLLLHFLLEQSFKLQHKEFNLLWGDQNYKLNYATHIRLIEDIGKRPFSRRIKGFVKRTLRRSPVIQTTVKKVYNKTARFLFK